MPLIRSLASKRCTLLAASISLNGEIISPYSHCTKKGLVYIIIADPSSRQPFSYIKYTKLNTCALCDIYSISLNKYMFLYCTRCCTY